MKAVDALPQQLSERFGRANEGQGLIDIGIAGGAQMNQRILIQRAQLLIHRRARTVCKQMHGQIACVDEHALVGSIGLRAGNVVGTVAPIARAGHQNAAGTAA